MAPQVPPQEGDEGGPSSPIQRVTRQSTSLPNPDPKLQVPRPSLKPLAPLEVKSAMAAKFPGRGRQVQELLNILGDANDCIPPLLVFGAASTGKSSVLRELLRLLGRPHAYVSCRSCHSPRLVFEAIINQLVGHDRGKAPGYGSHRRCDKAAEFIALLPGVVATATQRAKRAAKAALRAQKVAKKGGRASRAAAAGGSPAVEETADREAAECAREGDDVDEDAAGEEGDGVATNLRAGDGEDATGGEREGGPTIYVVVDNLELMRDWSGGESLISMLASLQEIAKVPRLGVILVSKVGWQGFRPSTGSREPLPVFFPDYSDEELRQVLLTRRPDSTLYNAFIRAVMPPFSRTCRRPTELWEATEGLFQRYLAAHSTASPNPSSSEDRQRLYAAIQPHIRASLMESLHLHAHAPERGSGAAIPGVGGKKRRTEFGLPRCAKLLLVAAFIASRNAPTQDASLFSTNPDPLGVRKKRRRVSAGQEKRDRQAQEDVLRGPGTFAIDRLLAIYGGVSAADTDMASQGRAGHQLAGTAGAATANQISTDVLLQVSTLVTINLLAKTGGDPLEGTARYQYSGAEKLAFEVASDIQFPLQKYLVNG